MHLLWWAAGSFWLLAHLGGIGFRSRRGYGSFMVVDVKQPVHEVLKELPPFQLSELLSIAESEGQHTHEEGRSEASIIEEAIKRSWNKLLQSAKQKLTCQASSLTGSLDRLPPYSQLPEAPNIWVTPIHGNKNATHYVASIIKEAETNYLKYEKRYMRIGYGYPRIKERIWIKDIHRRASPLLIRISKSGEKKYMVSSYIDSLLVPKNSQLIKEKDKRSIILDEKKQKEILANARQAWANVISDMKKKNW